VIGWNLPTLFDQYCLNIDPSLPDEYHYRSALKLAAILISGDEEIDDPSACFQEENVKTEQFMRFVTTFVDEIKENVCYNGNLGAHMTPNSKSYLQAVFGDMTSVVYSRYNREILQFR
jgi:hypothetical protein